MGGDTLKNRPAGGIALAFSRRGSLVAGSAFVALVTTGCSTEVAEPDEASSVALISLLSGIAIPTTDTLGAGDTNCARWVHGALEAGMRGGRLQTLVELEAALDQETPGRAFRKAPQAAQARALDAIDRQLAPAPAGKLSPWGIIKSLILRSYYTSETGASKELRYELVPGRFDPDIPVKPNDRAWSTDANARNLSL